MATHRVLTCVRALSCDCADDPASGFPKSDSVYDIGLQRAVELLAAPKSARGAGGKQLGAHPDDQQPVTLLSGRYGPYVKHGKVNATVSQDYDPATLTLQQAVDILAARQAKNGKGTKPKGRPTKPADKPKKTKPEVAAPASKARAAGRKPAAAAPAIKKVKPSSHSTSAATPPGARRKSA